MPRGYTHEDYEDGTLHMRSVKESLGWQGYPKILDWYKVLYDKVRIAKEQFERTQREKQSPLRYKGYDPEQVVMAYSAMFLTGGRVGETLALRRWMFSIIEDNLGKDILVHGMPLEKQFDRKRGRAIEVSEPPPSDDHHRWNEIVVNGEVRWRRFEHTTVKHLDATRNNFRFPLNEPLAEGLWNWIQKFENDKDYIFPARFAQSGHMDDSCMYLHMNRLGLWNHFMRSQRAGCLVVEHAFDENALMRWFSWKDSDVARMYVNLNSKQVAMKFNREILSKLNLPPDIPTVEVKKRTWTEEQTDGSTRTYVECSDGIVRVFDS